MRNARKSRVLLILLGKFNARRSRVLNLRLDLNDSSRKTRARRSRVLNLRLDLNDSSRVVRLESLRCFLFIFARLCLANIECNLLHYDLDASSLTTRGIKISYRVTNLSRFMTISILLFSSDSFITFW